MRICLVADYSAPDEARKVIAHNLYRELSKNHKVLRADLRGVFTIGFWKIVRDFEPHVLHYIPGASSLSFAITKALRTFTFSTKSKTVMFSMLHPFHSPFHGFYYFFSYLTKWTIPFTKTDLVIVQSSDAEKVFKKIGCNVKFMVCSGVDVNRFVSVSEKRKEELKKKYEIDNEKFVVLHVGSIRKWRNVEILKGIQSYPDIQVVVVGRISTKFEKNVALELEKRDCKIINGYIPEVEELYALSDCYVFPTADPVGSIDLPLSVLEAMSTNLPVITTKFGGLPRIFKEGDGLFFVKGIDETINSLKEIKVGNIKIRTREKVLLYSWENIARELEETYEHLVVCKSTISSMGVLLI